MKLPTEERIKAWATEEQFLLFCDEDDIVQIVNEALIVFTRELQKDKTRLDWLLDINNDIGHVVIPVDCVLQNQDDIRAAIDMAMGY